MPSLTRSKNPHRLPASLPQETSQPQSGSWRAFSPLRFREAVVASGVESHGRERGYGGDGGESHGSRQRGHGFQICLPLKFTHDSPKLPAHLGTTPTARAARSVPCPPVSLLGELKQTI